MKFRVTEALKVLVRLFDSLSGSKSLWEVFNDCMSLYSLAFQNVSAVGDSFIRNEAEYKKLMEKYKKSEQEIIFKIFSEIIYTLDNNPFQDLFGELYMRLNMGSDALGQFFTPYNISLLNAEAGNIQTLKVEISDKGFATVSEPACGAGANIIAFMQKCKDNGIDFQKEIIAVCQDLSGIAAKMCHVALSLLGVQAVIKIGDTLSQPFTSYFDEVKKGSHLLVTPQFIMCGGYRKV